MFLLLRLSPHFLVYYTAQSWRLLREGIPFAMDVSPLCVQLRDKEVSETALYSLSVLQSTAPSVQGIPTAKTRRMGLETYLSFTTMLSFCS